MTIGTTRYIAEWIAAQHLDKHGEWDPDMDEYGERCAPALELAKAIAVRESQKCNVAEWCRVTVEIFNASLGIPARSDAAWDVVATWHGDWAGNWQEDRS